VSVATPGTVYLVGAGPGDSGLITRRALELVRAADVLLVDRLIPHDLIDEAREDAVRVDVGKTAGNHAMAQGDINERLVSEALAGHIVVRVKGGDPYLFGRGGEEAAHCRAAGVPFEVIPAVTSAFAACADAGIPVTHRDIARHVTVVTASAGRDGQGDPNYGWLARSDGTVVLLMGLRRVAHVAERFIEEGRPASTPAAIISRGTTAQQRTLVGTLGTIGALLDADPLPSPAIIVIGAVVELREQLSWFEERPLFGTRVAVTRARAQASDLRARLEALGAQVVEAPAIRIEPLDPTEVDAVIASLDEVDTIAFTSANGASIFLERLRTSGRDARALSGTRIAVVGTPTARILRASGLTPDVIPPHGHRSGLGLLNTLAEHPLFGTTAAVIRAEHGDDRLVDGLERLGVRTTLARAYRTIIERPSDATIAALLECDVVTLASESTVRNLVSMLPEGAQLPPAVTIGPTTTAAALWARVRVLEESADPSIASVVESVVARAAANAGRGTWTIAAEGAPPAP